MAPHTTGVVFAVSMPEADRRSVGAAIDLLERIGVRLLGTVLTNVETGRSGKVEYGYGYGYGYGAQEGPRAVAAVGADRAAGSAEEPTRA